ncbi:MAG: ABC transporter permease [Edaphobacter sp.]
MHWFKQLFSRRRRYDELSETIREHLDEKIADLMDRGMTREQAESTARREFGNVTRIEERSREVWQWPRLESAWADVRYAVRRLWKSPGFTAMAVLMLAFGIGATTAIFSIVEGVLLRPLPFPDPGRLVVVSDVLQGVNAGNNGEVGVTGPDVPAYIRNTKSFDSLGGYVAAPYELSGAGDPAFINGARLTGGVFSTLGIAPLMGRVFAQQEDDQKQQVAVLSYATWQERLHGNPNVLGSKILLNRQPYIVIGVMPRDFEFPLLPGHLTRSELWVPMSFLQNEISEAGAGAWNFQMVGRLKPGISPQRAQTDADRAAQEIVRNYPSYMSSVHMNAVVRPLNEETVEQARPLINMLFLAVTVVLLIACANLAGLLLIRAIRRRRELSLRLALGAQGFALLRQQLLECLILSISGGVVGLGLAALALHLGRNLLPETFPLISRIGLNWRVVAFSLALAILTGLICAIAPTFGAMRTSVNEVLNEGGRLGSGGARHVRLRSVLVIAEIAVAMVLLNISGLLLRSFEKMSEVHLGYRPDHTLVAGYSLPATQYGRQVSVDRFNQELLHRLQYLPGSKAAALSSQVPASGINNNAAFLVEGYVPAKGEGLHQAWAAQVKGDFFLTMGITLLRGRTFTDADNAQSQLAAIVNQKLSGHFWPGQNPIGKQIRWGTPDLSTPWMTVVGEVEDVKQDAPDQEASEQIYQPLEQVKASSGSLAASASVLIGNGGFITLRTSLAPEQMQHTMLSAVRSIDPQLPLWQLQTMEHAVSDKEAPRRFNTGIITVFAAAAVLLAILGIYSIVTFSVAQRTQEMALRMALGSQRVGIVRLVLRSGMKLALVGCVLGLGGAAAASVLLRSFLLFGVSPFDPLVMVLTAASIFLLAFAASVIPARRAASVDPMQALRSE